MSAIRNFFDQLANEYDLKAFLISRGLRYLSNLELTFIYESIKGCSGKTILDLGTGTGRISDLVSKLRAKDLVGIDVSSEMMHQNRNSGAELIVADANMTPFKSNSFHFVIGMRVMKYTNSYSSSVKEASRVLGNGGTFVFDFANRDSIQILDRSRNYSLISINDMMRILGTEGFEIVRTQTRKRLPYALYRAASLKIPLSLIISIEKILSGVLPDSLLATDIMVEARKL